MDDASGPRGGSPPDLDGDADSKRRLAARHPERVARIDYTNYRGERRWRRVLPIATAWCHESNQWHGPGWRLVAFDFEKGDVREFPHENIHGWGPDGA